MSSEIRRKGLNYCQKAFRNKLKKHVVCVDTRGKQADDYSSRAIHLQAGRWGIVV